MGWGAASAPFLGSAESLYNGFRYAPSGDVPYLCAAGTTPTTGTTYQFGTQVYDVDTLAGAGAAAGYRGTIYAMFLSLIQTNGTLTADQRRKLYIAMQWEAWGGNYTVSDFGSYQLGALAYYMAHPSGVALQDVPVTVSALGGGKYTLTWTVPTGIQTAQSPSPYRIKWSPRIIAPSNSGTFAGFGTTDGLLNYDAAVTQTFGLEPGHLRHLVWRQRATVEPASLASGQSQSFFVG